MSYLQDLRGERFGRLVVFETAESPLGMKTKRRYWKCICDCGNEKIVSTKMLRSGLTKSCGCLTHDLLVERNAKHGQYGTRIYRIWSGMKSRCLNERDPKYSIYGGRGIQLCEEWNSFLPFYEWSKTSGYSDGLSIDRIDVNGNYEPSNCRWATPKEQANNTRTNIILTWDGQSYTISQWADKLNIPSSRIYARLKYGWSADEALSGKHERQKPTTRNCRMLTYNGKSQTIGAWAKETGLCYETIRQRLLNGWSEEDAISTKPYKKPPMPLSL